MLSVVVCERYSTVNKGLIGCNLSEISGKFLPCALGPRNFSRHESFAKFGRKKTKLRNEIWGAPTRNSGQRQVTGGKTGVGEGCTQYHPPGLTEGKELLPLASFGTDDDYLQNAQRRYSSAIHHRSWLKHKLTLQGCSRREAVRFIAVSQPHAGSFLNAVPSRHGFRVPTWCLRLELQRRLGLPLLAATAAVGRRSRHGRLFDALGDVAAADGEGGHQTRHFLTNRAIYDALRRVYGGQARREPGDYYGYSDHRPDVALLVEGTLTALDLKMYNPIGSQPADAGERGGFVAFGNTAEAANARVLGRRERGREGDGAFNRRTGEGHVAPVTGDYERALQAGVRCVPMLVETFGGFGPGLMAVLRQADDWRQGRLVSSEYDETTWAARNYMAFAAQRISVAVHIAAAQEIAEALGLSVAADPRE